MAVALLVEQQLVAFVEPQDVCPDAVRAACSKVLPYYAVPSEVRALPQLPKTSYVVCFLRSACALVIDRLSGTQEWQSRQTATSPDGC